MHSMPVVTIDYMPSPSTDTQSFSTFASLHRADQTHEPKQAFLVRDRMTGFVIAGIIVALTIGLVARIF
jgi:hypothetical protein